MKDRTFQYSNGTGIEMPVPSGFDVLIDMEHLPDKHVTFTGFDFHARFEVYPEPRRRDPQLGRWFAPDHFDRLSASPAMQFSNPYLGIGNNPVNFIDPDGRIAFLAPFLKKAIGMKVGATAKMAAAKAAKMKAFAAKKKTYLKSKASQAKSSIGDDHWIKDQYGNWHRVSDLGSSDKLNYIQDGWLNPDGSFTFLGDGSYVDALPGTSSGFPHPEFANLSGLSTKSSGGTLINWMEAANNVNNAVGGATSILAGNYSLTKNQPLKYAQRVGAKVRSAEVLSRASRIQSANIARSLGRISFVGGVLGTAGSAYNIIDDYNSNGNGWDDVNGWDVADLAVGTIGVAAFFVSNPIGWVAGIGVGVYFASRAIYQIANGQ